MSKRRKPAARRPPAVTAAPTKEPDKAPPKASPKAPAKAKAPPKAAPKAPARPSAAAAKAPARSSSAAAAPAPARRSAGWPLDLAIMVAAFALCSAIAGAAGATNLGTALSFGQIGFAISATYVLLRR